MKNDPLLFINSVLDVNEKDESQVIFDSRRLEKKSKTKHRLDDINAMLLYKLNILCEIKTQNTLFEGVVTNVNENYLELRVDKEKILIDINKIETINILKV